MKFISWYECHKCFLHDRSKFLLTKCHKSTSSVSWQITQKIGLHVYINRRTDLWVRICQPIKTLMRIFHVLKRLYNQSKRSNDKFPMWILQPNTTRKSLYSYDKVHDRTIPTKRHNRRKKTEKYRKLEVPCNTVSKFQDVQIKYKIVISYMF